MQYFPPYEDDNFFGAPSRVTPSQLVERVRNNSSDEYNPSPDALIELIHEVQTVAIVGLSRDPAKVGPIIPGRRLTSGGRPARERLLRRDPRGRPSAIPSPLGLRDR